MFLSDFDTNYSGFLFLRFVPGLCQGSVREGWKLLTPRLVSNSYCDPFSLFYIQPLMRMDYSSIHTHTHTHVDRQINSPVALFQAVMLVVVLFSLLVVIHLHNLMELELFIQILTLPVHLVQSPLTNAEIQICHLRETVTNQKTWSQKSIDCVTKWQSFCIEEVTEYDKIITHQLQEEKRIHITIISVGNSPRRE